MQHFKFILSIECLSSGSPKENGISIVLKSFFIGFVEKNTDSKIQSSAQGLFMLMTNGVGAVIGNIVAGVIIARWFESKQVIDGVEMLVKNWPGIWFTFAAYAMVVAILFVILFKYKHVREDVADFRH